MEMQMYSCTMQRPLGHLSTMSHSFFKNNLIPKSTCCRGNSTWVWICSSKNSSASNNTLPEMFLVKLRNIDLLYTVCENVSTGYYGDCNPAKTTTDASMKCKDISSWLSTMRFCFEPWQETALIQFFTVLFNWFKICTLNLCNCKSLPPTS